MAFFNKAFESFIGGERPSEQAKQSKAKQKGKAHVPPLVPVELALPAVALAALLLAAVLVLRAPARDADLEAHLFRLAVGPLFKWVVLVLVAVVPEPAPRLATGVAVRGRRWVLFLHDLINSLCVYTQGNKVNQ